MTTAEATCYTGAVGDTGRLAFTNAGVTMTYNIHLMRTVVATVRHWRYDGVPCKRRQYASTVGVLSAIGDRNRNGRLTRFAMLAGCCE